jgi:hypothetical protein
VRLLSLISRFERNTKSGDPFGVPEMVETGGSGSIRDDAWLLYGPLDAFKARDSVVQTASVTTGFCMGII